MTGMIYANSKKIGTICVILILVLAAYIRFAGLKDRGIMCADEGFYLNGAKTYYAGFSYFYKDMTHQPQGMSFSKYMFKYGGGYPYAGKPLIYPIIFLSFLVFGICDYSTLFISALCGVGSVWMIYYIGKEIFNKKVGMFSALFLSLSAYHIHYARSGLVSIALSTFFVLCAFYFYIKSLKFYNEGVLYRKSIWYVILTGAALATAVMCHYNAAWFFPFLLVMDIFSYFIKRSVIFTRQVFRSVIFIISYTCALGIYILPYQIAGYITKGKIASVPGGSYHIQSYFEQMKSIYNCLNGLHFSTKNSFFYITLLRIVENPVVLILAIAGLVLMGIRLRKKFDTLGFLVFVLCIFPLAMWSFYTYACGRTLVIIIPFLVLAAAYFFDWFTAEAIKNLRYKNIILIMLIGVTAGAGVYNSIPFMEEKTGYKRAIEYMRSNGGIKHISNNPAVSCFYAGNENTNVVSEFNLKDAIDMYQNKRYVFFLNISGRSEDEFSSRCLYDLIKKKRVRPVFISYSSPYIALFDYPVLIDDIGQLKKDMTIEVYKLKDILD